jgi:hypothetical protein
MNDYEKWLNLKERINDLLEQLHEVEAEIWLKASKDGKLNPKGSKSFENNGFKITIIHSDTVKVDQDLATKRPDLFRVKYEFNKSEYKNLIKSQKDFVDEVITIKPNKPSFRVERISLKNI